MKALKLFILWVAITALTTISWSVGTLVGNSLTHTAPPAPQDPGLTGMAFLGACMFNALLIAIMLFTTRDFRGLTRNLLLTLFVFVVQFLLPQMETFFFSDGMGISKGQTWAILISGAIVSVITVPLATLLHDKFFVGGANSLRSPIPANKRFIIWLAALFVGYPLLYLTFGYYVAWQSEEVRLYYTSSLKMRSYVGAIADALGNGIYLFQILRATLWISVTVPLVMMLRGNTAGQYLVIAVLTALLPTSLLFIPNPYMPWNVAMVHFAETSTSNFLWGMLMVWVTKKTLGI